MPFYKNTASQQISIYAWDTLTDLPATGISTSITGYIRLDQGSVAGTNDVNPSETDNIYMPGLYDYDVTQTESNADKISLSSLCSTTGVSISPIVLYTEDISNIPSVGSIADAVWDEPSSAHIAGDKMGYYNYNSSSKANNINVNIGTPTVSVATYLASISGYTDSLEADITSQSSLLLETTIDVAVDTTTFHLTSFANVDDIYNDQMVVFFDATNSNCPSVRRITDYNASLGRIYVDSAPDYTVAGSDNVKIFAVQDVPTISENRAEMDSNSTMLAAISGYTESSSGLTASDVKEQIVAALSGDTYGEPSQGIPPTTASLATKLSLIHKYSVNKVINDGSYISVYNTAGSVVDHKAAIDETTGLVTRDGFVSGP